MATAILLFQIFLFFLQYYLNIRSDKILKLRKEVLDLCTQYNGRHIHDKNFNNAYDWCYDCLPTYSNHLYSFKTLDKEKIIGKEHYEELLN